MTQEQPNPYLQQENYFEGYNESIKELKNNPEVIAFDKLCYEIFEHQEVGRKFLEIVRERFLYPPLVQRGPNYTIDVLWQEGFKDAWRSIISSVMAHKQRIIAGTKS